MSTFPVPNYVAENAARLEKMSKDFGATLPKDMAAAIDLMSQPAAGVAALTAIGFGLAGQAFGMWAGAVAGAAEASQRLFVPLAPKLDKRSAAGPAASAVTRFARPKPVLKVVAKPEPAPKVVVKAEPAPKIAARVGPATEPVAKAAPAPKVVVKAEPAPKIAARIGPGTEPVARAEPAPKVVVKAEPAPKIVAKVEPNAEPVAKAEPVRRTAAKAEPAKPVAAAAVIPVPEAVRTDAPALMPEDFRKPRSIERPAAPDDLKAISGVGPKLEKVLNDLGVWTYAQVAAWGKEEVAWVDDYLAFSGRIGRDKWIEQARELATNAGKKN